jgi:hypothetical protein
VNFFFDTEFSETGGQPSPTIELISIGVVSEDGREFYAESSEFNLDNCNDWVKANVLPRLGPPEQRQTRAVIRDGLKAFLGESPVLWAYYASYDWVVFCWLFGMMVDLPKGYPMFPMDLQQRWVTLGKPKDVKPPNTTAAHNALVDAKWNLQLYLNLQEYITKSMGEVQTIVHDHIRKVLKQP